VISARYPALLVLLALAGCAKPQSSQTAAATEAAVDLRAREIEERKDAMLRDLATCESGGHGETDHPIYGGRGLYVGRFQFTVRTVITYVQQMDGRVLTPKEATALAHDYEQAATLAKFMIFERDRIGEWPLCARKLQLARQVAEIRAM